MNSKYQSGEKININKIFFEDSFIELINQLSNSISDYYNKSSPLIRQFSNIFQSFEKNINQLISINEINNDIYYNNNQEISAKINDFKNDYIAILKKLDENFKSFLEKSKSIFKEMKEKKNAKVEEIYNDYAHSKSLKNKEQNYVYNSPNVDPFRLSHLSKTSSSSQSQNRERNKNNNKVSITNKTQNSSINNGPVLKNLINQMSNFANVISIHSNEEKENYIKLQKQMMFELNKFLSVNSSKSVERKNTIKTNTISAYNTNNTNTSPNNPFIMVNNNNNNVNNKENGDDLLDKETIEKNDENKTIPEIKKISFFSIKKFNISPNFPRDILYLDVKLLPSEFIKGEHKKRKILKL